MLSEINQIHKNKYFMMSLACEFKRVIQVKNRMVIVRGWGKEKS